VTHSQNNTTPADPPLIGINVRCQPHALPFRTLFEEQRLRRPQDLLAQIRKYLPEPPDTTGDDNAVLARLDRALLAAEELYKKLDIATREQGDEEISKCEKECHTAEIPLKKILHGLGSNAICFSGGGIRSATFCLGVLEGLARFSEGNGTATTAKPPLLQSFDYLSTVSGGGYIGSWLMSWISRRGNLTGEAYKAAITALACSGDRTSGDPEPRTIRHLRDYTSYLAPKLGLTLDTWALISIVLRNLLVTWAMIVPLFLCAIAIAQVLHFGLIDARIEDPMKDPHVTSLVWIAGALYAIAALVACWRMPSRQKPVVKNREPWIVVGCFVLPLLAASLLLTEVGFGYAATAGKNQFQVLFEIGLVSFGTIALSILVAYYRKLQSSKRLKTPIRWLLGIWRTLEVAAAALVIAAVTALALISLLVLFGKAFSVPDSAAQNLFVLLGIPAVLGVLLVASSFLSGLLGLLEQEIDREWWARSGGLLLIVMLVWIIIEALVIYGAQWDHALKIAVAGMIAGAFGAAAGWSGATSAGTRPLKNFQVGKLAKFLAKYHLVLPSLCAAGLMGILLLLTALEEKIRVALQHLQWRGFKPSTDLRSSLVLAGAAFFLALAINWAININIFSLHGMYRMRLMRAYLGASNPARHPDDFVGFDPNDTPAETDLPCAAGIPLHIINATLNLVGTQNLAWQQRKAEPFTISPVCCGSWRIGYVSTEDYAGERGLTLATAMAISGAAFNPNMGYHSSPLVTLLMTLLNVRLGWWLPNPRRAGITDTKKPMYTGRGKQFLRKNGPSVALLPLLKEALGGTNDDDSWIELTDGAHFENLGVYEMVLRRCPRILVIDVGADPNFEFEDLGNAIRKIQIDFGIPIRFTSGLHMQKKMMPNNSYCAIAEIDYGCVDSSMNYAAPTGQLIYLKPCLTGNEPRDVKQYAVTHPSFPHETTANQFFNESQFESYRHLGSFIVDQIASNAPSSLAQDGKKTCERDLDTFWAAARVYSEANDKANRPREIVVAY
jgi:hypothetical protein